jgi:hypothetical protein
LFDGGRAQNRYRTVENPGGGACKELLSHWLLPSGFNEGDTGRENYPSAQALPYARAHRHFGGLRAVRWRTIARGRRALAAGAECAYSSRWNQRAVGPNHGMPPLGRSDVYRTFPDGVVAGLLGAEPSELDVRVRTRHFAMAA